MTVAERNALVVANLGLVGYVAKRLYPLWHNAGLDNDDAIQAGTLGLQEAANRFDPSRGWAFSTYACIWIRQQIQTAAGRGKYRHSSRRPVITAVSQLGGDHGWGESLFGAAEPPILDLVFDLRAAVGKLTGQQRFVIEQRFFEGRVLKEVGDELGMTKERVRQIQDKAMERLRRLLGENYLEA